MTDPNPDLSDPKAIEAHFLAALPRIEAHAKVKFHRLTPEARDDAIAKVLGLAWKAYASEIAKGRNPDEYISAIAEFSVRQVRDGRDVTGMEKAKDALSPRARKRNGIEVQTLPEQDTNENESLDGLEARQSSPAEQAAFRHDFPLLVESLPAKQADLVCDAAIGETTTELAEKHGVSLGRVSQIRTLAKEKWSEMAKPLAERER